VCGACGRHNKETRLGCRWGKVEGKISLVDVDVDGRMCTVVIWPGTVTAGRGFIKTAMKIQAA
jgi:hypothetical protein